MLILLPPSETKRTGGSGAFAADRLFANEQLGETRERVRGALIELSRGEQETAAKALKLGVKNRGELAYNLELDASGVLPAIERYTGVLYDALAVDALDDSARAWVDAHVRVQSALFGLVGAADPIPAYRLSGGSRLPALGAPLKRVWKDAHRAIDWSVEPFVLDLRSKDYAVLAPLPEHVGYFLNVVQRGADGQVRALNHFNKAAKGELVRRLARSAPRIHDAAGLLAWAEEHHLEMQVDAQSRTITLVTELGAPSTGS